MAWMPSNLRIRYKLLLSYSAVFVLTISLGSAVVYSLVRRTIEENIESELTNSTSALFHLVRTSAAVAIKNHLRAVAEKNRDIAAHFYAQYRKGLLSEREAKARTAEVLLSQRIGKTGYIYCLDSRGDVVLHPSEKLLGVDVSGYAFVRQQKALGEGYLEYEWRNPGETTPRAKALYMTRFTPWDWIISVSAYRDEFLSLVNVDDFRSSVLSLRFGRTGYSYVSDRNGNAIIHPVRQGMNIFAQADVPARFFREMLARRQGKIVYQWKNPGETIPRQKLVIFNYIPEYEWVVASSSYLDEIYAPLRRVRGIVLATVIASLLLVLPLTFRISASITNPLKELMGRLAEGARGDLSARVQARSRDEVGRLAEYFNIFMERLEKYSASLRDEIRERTRAEEMFSKAFQSSPNGVSITVAANGAFLDVNETFLRLTGYTRDEVLGRTAKELGLFPNFGEASAPTEDLLRQGHLSGHEAEFRTKAGELRLGRLRAEPIEVGDKPCLLTTIEDITDWRRLEREVLEIGDRERRRIGEELHDDLGPHLLGVRALSNVLQRRLAPKAPEEAEHAEKIKGLIAEAIGKTRALARGLCPVHLGDKGLELALRQLAKDTESLFGIPCTFASREPALVEDNTVATQLFYIAREAIHNALKHAEASRLTIDLEPTEGGGVRLSVRDDGRGLASDEETGGMGLRIMGFRAEVLGATLELRSEAGKGTVVAVSTAARAMTEARSGAER